MKEKLQLYVDTLVCQRDALFGSYSGTIESVLSDSNTTKQDCYEMGKILGKIRTLNSVIANLEEILSNDE